MIKKLAIWCICLAVSARPLSAQLVWPTAAFPGWTAAPDSLVLTPPPADSLSTADIFRTLAGQNALGGQVRVVQEQRMENLLDAYRAQYDVAVIPGFRVHIFSATGNDARQRAQQALAAFSEAYPEITPYLSYDEPYFKIYVGDFRIKTDALRFQRRIAHNYPAAFISADMIRVKPAVSDEPETPQP